jgi:hypothetical protein
MPTPNLGTRAVHMRHTPAYVCQALIRVGPTLGGHMCRCTLYAILYMPGKLCTVQVNFAVHLPDAE